MDEQQRDIEQAELEQKLVQAFQEALSKTELALSETLKKSEGFVKKIWAAAESAEYTSLLYSLTYDLQDYDPKVDKRRREDTTTLLKDALQSLKLAIQERESGASKNGYDALRTSAEYLKTAYLDQTRGSATRRATVPVSSPPIRIARRKSKA